MFDHLANISIVHFQMVFVFYPLKSILHFAFSILFFGIVIPLPNGMASLLLKARILENVKVLVETQPNKIDDYW